MYLDKANAAQLARRRGLACRTVAITVWLLFCGVVAYFIAGYLFAEELLRYELFYRQLGLPTAVPRWVVLTAVAILLVLVMQLLLLFGFFLGSPGAWRRSGRPSAASPNADFLEDDYF